MSADSIEILIGVLRMLMYGIVVSFSIAMVALVMVVIAWARLSELENPSTPGKARSDDPTSE